MLLQEEDGLKVVGEAADGENLLSQMVPAHPDIVLLDWDLPGAPIQTLLSAIRASGNHTYVVVLSGRPEDEGSALAAGADIFVSKANPPTQLVEAMNVLVSREGHGE
jgi:two-component system invasion response regulator UvrY